MIVYVLGKAMNEDMESHIMSSALTMMVTTLGSKNILEGLTMVREAVTVSTTQLNRATNSRNFRLNDDDVFDDDDEEVNERTCGGITVKPDVGPSAPGGHRCPSIEETDAQEVSGSVTTRLRGDVFLVSWSTSRSRLSRSEWTQRKRQEV